MKYYSADCMKTFSLVSASDAYKIWEEAVSISFTYKQTTSTMLASPVINKRRTGVSTAMRNFHQEDIRVPTLWLN